MRPVDFQEVQKLVSLDMVLGWINWRPLFRDRGGRRGPCPIHKGDDPTSRSFTAKGNEWFCWKCRVGGGQIQLYATLYGMKPLAAAVEMCQRAGLDVPYRPRRPRQPRVRGTGSEGS